MTCSAVRRRSIQPTVRLAALTLAAALILACGSAGPRTTSAVDLTNPFLGPEQSGWLAGARDPIVGGALSLLHRDPGHAWNVEELASRLGTSRTVLTERFDRFLGEPVLTYLARWRLQLAARLLETSNKSIEQIAADVGYTSQAAFTRAFRRQFEAPPAQYRRQARNAAG